MSDEKETSRLTKQQAQRRADRLRAFREELTVLTRNGVLELSEEQRQAVDRYHGGLLQELAQRYDIDASEDQKKLSLGMRVASLLGAIAFCAAAYLFFYNYWGLLSTTVQVVLLAGAPVAGLMGVELAARKERTLYFASLAAAVSFACFVLNLGALGHIFNIVPSHNALLAWSLFGLLLAFTYGLRLLLLAGSACGIVYIASCIALLAGTPWDTFLMRPENLIPAGAVPFVAGLLPARRTHPGFSEILRSCGLIAMFFAFIILSTWGDGSYLYRHSGTVEVCYQLLGFLLSGLAIWLGIRRGWTDVTYLASSAFAILLIIQCFHWWWDWMPKYLFFLILGLVAVSLLLVLKYLRRSGS